LSICPNEESYNEIVKQYQRDPDLLIKMQETQVDQSDEEETKSARSGDSKNDLFKIDYKLRKMLEQWENKVV
jgi:hypothetical protein